MTSTQWKIVGGLALAFGIWAITQKDDLLKAPPDSEFDQQELGIGTAVELEHTESRATAKRIAKHHLMEDDRYYQKLATVHLD